MADLPLHSASFSLLVKNMHCPSCVDYITSLLSTLTYVRDVSVSLLLHTVTFRLDPQVATSSTQTETKLVDEVTALLSKEGGFELDRGSIAPSRTEDAEKPKRSWAGRWGRREKKQMTDEQRRQLHLEHCEACRSGLPLEPTEEHPRGVKEGHRTVTTLSIGGMTCVSCSSAITSALQQMEGVFTVNIDLLANKGTVTHDFSLSPDRIAEELNDLGYEGEVTDSQPIGQGLEPKIEQVQTILSIDGMTCASCTSAITSALRSLEGVNTVNIDLLANKGTILHSSTIPAEKLKEAVDDIGYDAEIISTAALAPPKPTTNEQNALRTINVRVDGIYCSHCTQKLNAYLATLPLQSFTQFVRGKNQASIVYKPHEPLTIRDILLGLSNVSPEFTAHLVKSRPMHERSREIQEREARHLAINLAIAFIFAIPTFIIGVVGMALVPSSNALKMWCMTPIWGAANKGTIFLWPIATVVQFGIGRIFYQRAFSGPCNRMRNWLRGKGRGGKWSPKSLVSFGSMDLLVALSTSVSYFASLAMLILDIRHAPSTDSVGTYFDSCVFLIMFILLGRVLEAFAKRRTMSAVDELGKMRSETAILVDRHGVSKSPEQETNEPTPHTVGDEAESGSQSHATRTVPVDHLEVGDLIIVPPGSSPPTDGNIETGSTTIDESSLTGESLPVSRKNGDPVYTGTLNLTSPITIRVASIGQSTMLEKIISAVSSAGARKTPLEHLAERLTSYFVPLIVYLALVVTAIWLGLALSNTVNLGGEGGRVFSALEFGISVLVVACPCGIGLAVPCANAVGASMAATKGILAVSGGEGWNAAEKVGAVVTDKTGTLTLGKAAVVDEYWPTPNVAELNKGQLEKLVSAVEARSTHPLARGVVEHLNAATTFTDHVEVDIKEAEEISGKGVRASAVVDKQDIEVLVGNQPLLTSYNVELPVAATDCLGEWGEQAYSAVLVAVRQARSPWALRAAYALSDPLRPEAPAIVAHLRGRGRVVICTGDREDVAQSIARQLHIPPEDVKAGVGPEGKAAIVEEVRAQLQRESAASATGTGKPSRLWWKKAKSDKVMFVGDGMNDAVALAAADVGVAMGHGSEVAVAGADFVLLNPSLSALTTLLALSRRVSNRQKLNLAWACVFNLVCIPFAAGAFWAVGLRLTPVWSAVLMALSSVSVVCSSLALRWEVAAGLRARISKSTA